MKKSFIKLVVTLQFLLKSILLIQAQNQIDYKAEGGLVQFNIFHFEGTDKYDLVFPVTNKMDTLKIRINAYISAGELSIEICDPTGERQGNFILQGQSSLSKSLIKNEIRRSTEMTTSRKRIEKNPWIFKEEDFKSYGMGSKVAQASISRSVRNPSIGDWIVKVTCKDSKGLFTVENNERLVKDIMPTKFVTGTVIDKKNKPLPGAIIKIKDEYAWTTSDDKGEFTVSIRDQVETIIIQHKKMIPKEIIIGDQPKIIVVLEPIK